MTHHPHSITPARTPITTPATINRAWSRQRTEVVLFCVIVVALVGSGMALFSGYEGLVAGVTDALPKPPMWATG